MSSLLLPGEGAVGSYGAMLLDLPASDNSLAIYALLLVNALRRQNIDPIILEMRGTNRLEADCKVL